VKSLSNPSSPIPTIINDKGRSLASIIFSMVCYISLITPSVRIKTIKYLYYSPSFTACLAYSIEIWIILENIVGPWNLTFLIVFS